ncbi:MAG: stage III sporulation protein AA [Syntrophomonadaceae bacterium]|nr:stage III sporulation protein AA [Syntrophomonadaceae bacterium]
MSELSGRWIKDQIIPYLSPALKNILFELKEEYYSILEEIRLRCGKPLILKLGNKDYTVDCRGRVIEDLKKGYQVNREDIYRTVASISDSSLYAFEEEIRRGFITVPGGYRVGLAGQIVMQGDEIKTITDFSGICFRVAREIKDCAKPLVPYIYSSGTILNTLIISPPRCGKTTILRDLARIFSTGVHRSHSVNVVVVDERSEIAGSFRGIPQLDVGPRTDVLDSCPKAAGMIMAIRALSPQLIITDEIGRREDVEAILECVNAGVSVISSIHARDLNELEKRPLFGELLRTGAFRIGVVISRREGPGTLEEIIRWD